MGGKYGGVNMEGKCIGFSLQIEQHTEQNKKDIRGKNILISFYLNILILYSYTIP